MRFHILIVKNVCNVYKSSSTKIEIEITSCDSRRAIGALQAFKVEVNALFKVTDVVSTW